MSRTKLRRYFRHGSFPQLMVFEAVARLGSVTRAAEELHLAQPTVSLQLKKLAEALAVQLFEQRGRRLHLTGAGRALQEGCRELTGCLLRADEKLDVWRAAGREGLELAAEPEAGGVAVRQKGRELVEAAALFLREALLLDATDPAANNSHPEEGEEGRQWKSRETTTRRQT